jgi:signal peptidase II
VAGIAAAGVAVDQATKALALARLDPARPVALVDGWLQLWLSRNPGAAFSLGERFTYVFSALAIVVLVAVLVWVGRTAPRRSWLVLTGLGLAGVAGNLVDRFARAPGVLRGHVVDFIFVRHFATFNVADVCLTTAAGLLILFVLRGVTPDASAAPGAASVTDEASVTGEASAESGTGEVEA